MCGVLVALAAIETDESPAFLAGSAAWPPAAAPRNLAALKPWSASLERGDCVAFDLRTAWRGGADAVWRERSVVMVLGGEDGATAGGEEVWVDELRGLRGATPTTVVQWSKGVPPPDQEHYT